MASSSDREVFQTGAQTSALTCLAPEILCLIVSFLDPISLISLSQSSRGLRSFIRPTRAHLVQRLLSLELLPGNNGVNQSVPLFRGRDSTMHPDPTDVQAWEGIRYACAGCLRLRSHMHFVNHSDMQLGLRKPPPGSLEATKLTDWEPLDDSGNLRTRCRRIQQRKEKARQNYKIWQRDYHNAIHISWDLITPDYIALRDQEAEEAERYICGTARHLRRCNECRYERGDFRRHTTSNYNTSDMEVPIIKSRRRNFYTEFERYFPGLFADLFPPPEQRYRSQRMPYYPEAQPNPWVLSMVRCKRCGLFKELAAFRYGDVFQYWKPSGHASWWHRAPGGDGGRPGSTESRLCSPCFGEVRGPGALLESLAVFALSLAKADLSDAAHFLRLGWITILNNDGLLWKIAHGSPRNEGLAAKALPALNYSGTGRGGEGIKEVRSGEADMEAMHALHQEVYRFVNNEASEEIKENMRDWVMFRVWVEDYEKGE